jgi:hypothetical protein
MKPKFYQLLVQCVEDGVAYGYNRAHKHTDNPTPDVLKMKIEDGVLNAISEWFTFDEEDLP